MSHRLFKHSGDLGDILYALPTILAFGGGVLCVNEASFTRNRVTPQAFGPLAVLLKAQPYVQDVVAYDPREHVGAIDLDTARAYRREAVRPGSGAMNLADSHLRCFGFTTAWRDKPWLEVSRDAALDLYSPAVRPGFFRKPFVVFARSSRYRNRKFPWLAVWEKYAGRSVFVGTPGEHHEFCSTVGTVPYVPTKDFLELALLIKRSALFVGNQSAPYAVAEGLKHATVQETYPEGRDCVFERENAIYGLDGDVITSLPGVA